MINLLPPEFKQEILYARRNTKLLRWTSAIVVVIAGIGLIVGFGFLYLKTSTNAYTTQLADTNQQLKAQKLDQTSQRVEDISSSLKLVTQVLSREVLFSKLVQQIGAAMPANTVLTDLQINKLQGGIDLSAQAVDYKTATQIQVNLQDPSNQIFAKADIVNISCNANGTGTLNSRYPCTVQIRALFATNNPFLFINGSKS
jgi:hypothetical protein